MGGYYYTTEQGDMWDFIAWKVYKNEKMIETLMKAEENRKLLDIYIFSAGTKVGAGRRRSGAERSGALPAFRRRQS